MTFDQLRLSLVYDDPADRRDQLTRMLKSVDGRREVVEAILAELESSRKAIDEIRALMRISGGVVVGRSMASALPKNHPDYRASDGYGDVVRESLKPKLP